MKQTKKIIAALAAATMVASCAGVVASAAEAVNAVNVSYFFDRKKVVTL